MLIVVLLLGIAAYNRRVLTPALHSGSENARRALRRNVLIEIALVGVILALTASFSLTPPPRSLPALAVAESPTTTNEPPGYTTVTSANGWTAVVEVLPARIGNNWIRVSLTDTQGQPGVFNLVSEWQQADTRIQAAIPVVNNDQMLGNVNLPTAGRWRVHLRWEGAGEQGLRLTVPIPDQPTDFPPATE